MEPRATCILSGALLGAGVAAPAGALGTLAWVPVPWPLLVVLVALSGGAGGAFVGHRVPDHVEMQPPRARARWLVGLLVPLSVVVGAALAWTGIPPAPGVWVPLAVGGVLTLAGGLGMTAVAQRARADWAVEESEVLVELGPQKSERQRRVARGLGGLGVVAVALVAAAEWATGGDVPWVLLVMGLGALTPLVDSEQHVALLEGGVRVGDRVLPYDDYESVELTDDRLTIHADAWWRGPIWVACDGIDDADRAVAVLEERLERAE